jgi:hypothetical protein
LAFARWRVAQAVFDAGGHLRGNGD